MTYIVSDEGQLIRGTAQDVLRKIKEKKSSIESDIEAMNFDEYVRTLIENAKLFLPGRQAAEINKLPFDSEYDRALALLSAMPASDTHILRSN